MRRVRIDPVTRIEGHGAVEIFLDEHGEVANAYLQVPELRGFERLCVGRPAEEMPRITSRICGLCPEAHQMASVKALDALFGAVPPPAARMVRELLYCAFFVLDHATHAFALAGPDLYLDAATPTSERNLFGVIRALGDDLGREIVATRMRNVEVIHRVGGRGVHPEAALPGGWSRRLDEETRKVCEQAARANIAFALDALVLFRRRVLGNGAMANLMTADAWADRTYSLGTVDAANRPNFYDGILRVVDPGGAEFARFEARDYRDHVAERVESWTYLKLPYLKRVGWKGLVDGPGSGIYSATPLARLNVADAMPTPRAQEAFEALRATVGSRTADGRRLPIHNPMVNHWARLVELLYASERMLELATDPEVTGDRVRTPVGDPVGEAVGSVEAPRGTLVHHYWTDERGILTRVNLVVGTTNNHAAISLSLARAARALFKAGSAVGEALLNRVEMVVRAYDPCLSCATHALSGPGLVSAVLVRDCAGRVVERLDREQLMGHH
jgi:F420-non-reducing hydrogenase large subunit